MKFILTLLLLINCRVETPKGIWLHLEKNTKIEIYEKNGMLYGRLLPSNFGPERIGKDILRKLHCENGQWNGEIYNIKKKRWESVKIIPKGEVLFLEIKYGFITKKLRWFLDKKN